MKHKFALPILTVCFGICLSLPLDNGADDTGKNNILEDYAALKHALLSGHTVSVTLNPNKCMLSTLPKGSTAHVRSFTTRHWSIENSGDEHSETIVMTNLYLEKAVSAGGSAAPNDDQPQFQWVRQAVRFQNDNFGEFSEVPSLQTNDDVSNSRHSEHFGSCKMTTGLVFVDITGKDEEMVLIDDFATLRTELESGRQIEGWVDYSSCNMTSNLIQGFTVDSFLVKPEKLTIETMWPDISPNNRELEWEGHILTLLKEGGSSAQVLPVPRKELVSENAPPVPRICTDHAIQLFSKRIDTEKTFDKFEDLPSSMKEGHGYVVRIHEGYSMYNDNGSFLGDHADIRGQRLDNYEYTRFNDVKKIEFNQHRLDPYGVPTTTKLELDADLGKISGSFSDIQGSSNIAPMFTSYLGSSAFLTSPTEKVLMSFGDLVGPEDVIAVTGFGGFFENMTSSTNIQDEMRRITFSTVFLEDSEQLTAISSPVKVIKFSNNGERETVWQRYQLTLKENTAEIQENWIRSDLTQVKEGIHWETCIQKPTGSLNERATQHTFCSFNIFLNN